MVEMAGEPEDWLGYRFLGGGGSVFRRKRHPKLKCTAENTIYARRIHTSNKKDSRFIVLTKIGVHDYGKDLLKTMHCGLRFECKDTEYPRIEIEKILPTDTLKEVGTVTVEEKRTVDMGGGVNAEVKTGNDLKFLKWDVGGRIRWD